MWQLTKRGWIAIYVANRGPIHVPDVAPIIAENEVYPEFPMIRRYVALRALLWWDDKQLLGDHEFWFETSVWKEILSAFGDKTPALMPFLDANAEGERKPEHVKVKLRILE